MTRNRYFFFVFFSLIFSSCGGPTGDVTFFTIQRDILTPKCATSGCHNESTTANANLALSNIDESYDMLLGSEGSGRVGRVSTQKATVKRVDPGDPDISYLYQKITSNGDIAASTVRMPPNTSLSDVEIETIREWIADGAHK